MVTHMEQIEFGENLLLYRFLKLTNNIYDTRIVNVYSGRNPEDVYFMTSSENSKYKLLIYLREKVLKGNLDRIIAFNVKSARYVDIGDPIMTITNETVDIMNNTFKITQPTKIKYITRGEIVDKYLLSEAIENNVKFPSSILTNILNVFRNIDPFVTIYDNGIIDIGSSHKGSKLHVIIY